MTSLRTSRFTHWNCGRCGYLALSSPDEDTDKGTETHKCPTCGEQWWLDADTYARMETNRRATEILRAAGEDAMSGPPRIAKHWRRGGKVYGTHGAFIVVHVWWPLSDPCPRGSLWP